MGTLEVDRSIREHSDNGRQCTRGDVAIIADIRVLSGGRNKVTVLDLSQTGFRMECMTDIPDDRTIFLTIPSFAQMEAKIAWRTEWLYGCEFARPLYAAIFDHIVGAYPALATRTISQFRVDFPDRRPADI